LFILRGLDHALHEKTKTENKVSSLVAKVGKLSAELEEERQLNRSLRQNQVERQEDHVEKQENQVEQQENQEPGRETREPSR
jgi:hypothetical protein